MVDKKTEGKSAGVAEIEDIYNATQEVLWAQKKDIENGGYGFAPIVDKTDSDEDLLEFGKTLKTTYDEINTSDSIDSNIMRENANINADTAMGMMLKIGSESSKAYAGRYAMSAPFAKAHADGFMHIHDLDFLLEGTTTCTQIDVDALFERGFSTGHGHLRTPNDITSYAALTCIAIQSNQNDQHGGQSIPNFDYALAKGVAKTFIKKYKLAMMSAVEIKTVNPVLDDYTKVKAAVENLIAIAEGTTSKNASLAISPEYQAEELKGIIALGFDETDAKAIQKYAYDTACRETDKSTYQAMEALVHNLNTMQCLPYSEEIWVKVGDAVRLMKIGDVAESFEQDKYEVLSINRETGLAEWKPITAAQRKDNHRRLVTLKTKGGQTVTVTDNHRMMTVDADTLDIVESMPEETLYCLSPREIQFVSTKPAICVDDYGTPRVDTPYAESHIIMSEELAELMGIYAGDGYITGGSQIALAVAFKMDREYLQELVDAALGQHISIYDVTVLDKYPEYRFNVGTRFCRMMASIVGDKSINKKVPSQVLLGSDEIKLAFLRGYFATDGRHTTKYQESASVSRELSAGVALLIQSLGEFPHRAVVENEEHNDHYTVTVGSRACERIGIDTARSGTAFEIPRYDLSILWNEIKKETNYGGVPRRSGSHAVRYQELDMFLNEFGNDHPKLKKFMNFFICDVVSREISDSGAEFVYDIEVADNENFMTRDGIFVHNSRAGSQVPFSSINYGTDTSAEGRMVIKNILEATQAGLGRGETAIFPVQVFKVKEGLNYNPGDPNYDLFRLAMETSARRLFPNFEFLDAPFNLQYYKAGHPETEVATMGCVAGHERIVYEYNETRQLTSFASAWDMLVLSGEQIQTSGNSEYIEPADMTVYDTSMHGFVKVLKVIKNPDKDDWYKIKFSDGKELMATADHPLPIENKGRTFVSDLKIGDRVMVSDADTPRLFGHARVDKVGDITAPAETILVCITSVDHIPGYGQCSYDVETETDRFDVSGLCSHNCRTRVMGNFFDPTREIAYGRGNLSFTSINLPRLAIEAEGDIDKFFHLLQEMLEVAVAQLDERVAWQMSKHVYNFPMLMGQGVWIDSETRKQRDEIGDILLHGSISVGFIGLAETLVALVGKHHGESEEAQSLGLKIVGYMRSYLDRLSKERKRNYTLLATPAEGLSGRFVNIDRRIYGNRPGITDREYYTNSFHVPVYYEITAYDKIHVEAPYHSLCNAGHISYVELDGMPSKNMDSYESIIRCMHDAGIGYASVNFPLDTDPVCGYRGVIREGDRCPKCGRDEREAIDNEGTVVKFTRIRRVTGYLSGDYETRFNDAKKAEVRDRVKHGVGAKAMAESKR